MKKILILILAFAACSICLAPLFALNIDKVKVAFLSGDYKEAISEGERLLAGAEHSEPNLDKLYYLMALSYMQDGNYLRACDIFEIILKEFKSSQLQEEALLGLADTYLLRGDLTGAERAYNQLIAEYPSTELKEQVYQRLAKVALNRGDKVKAEDYLKRAGNQSAQEKRAAIQDEGSCAIPAEGLHIFYTVQVGCFTNKRNAERLKDKLAAKKYEAYIEETISAEGQKMSRVRVTKLSGRQEAVRLKQELSRQGYPTKIYP